MTKVAFSKGQVNVTILDGQGTTGRITKTIPEETETTGHVNFTVEGESGVNPNVRMDDLVTEVVRQLEERKNTVQDKQQEYKESFTIHGLSRICTGNRTESWFWSLIVLIGISISTYIMYDQVAKYFRYEVYTTISNHVPDENIFPGITICDLDLARKVYNSYCGHDILSFRPDHPLAGNPCNYSLVSSPPFLKNILNSTHEWSNGYFHVTYCLTGDGKWCHNDDYIQSVRWLNHACFRLNWNGNLHDISGTMYLDFKFNASSGVNASKISMVIHDHEVESDNRLSTILEPGKITKVIVKKKEIKRLPHPFPSNCVKGKGNDIYPGKYSVLWCLNSLYNLDILKSCGDATDDVRHYIPEDTFQKYWRVNQTWGEVVSCFYEYIGRKKNFDKKLCPDPCQEMEFDTTVTRDEFQLVNYYGIHIALHKIGSYTIVEEHQMYTWEQIAGQIGGFVGLVIGASFISIIEIIAYLGLCLINKCSKMT